MQGFVSEKEGKMESQMMVGAPPEYHAQDGIRLAHLFIRRAEAFELMSDYAENGNMDDYYDMHELAKRLDKECYELAADISAWDITGRCFNRKCFDWVWVDNLLHSVDCDRLGIGPLNVEVHSLSDTIVVVIRGGQPSDRSQFARELYYLFDTKVDMSLVWLSKTDKYYCRPEIVFLDGFKNASRLAYDWKFDDFLRDESLLGDSDCDVSEEQPRIVVVTACK